jgi:hypothetical protein
MSPQFNGASQFNYAAKHNPMVFFTDTNGGDDATPANPLSTHYGPLQQLLIDLANSKGARLAPPLFDVSPSIPIPGATDQGYRRRGDDLGARISCRVTAGNQGGSTQAVSASSPPVVQGGQIL